MAENPSPDPKHPIPGGGNPIEINTGDLHSKPEIDIGTIPATPSEEETTHPASPPAPDEPTPGTKAE